jgi:uncharacterized membrane protein YbjE (DUF340 family)
MPLGWAFVALVLGVVAGATGLLPAIFLPWLSRLTTLGLALLLFTMGAQIGANPLLLASLQTLGLQAAALAISTVLGSILAVWLLTSTGLLSTTTGGAVTQDGLGATVASGGRWSMTVLILLSVSLGIAGGALGLLPAAYIASLNPIAEFALGVILLGIGAEMGHNRQAWRALKRLGPRVFLVPAGIAIGSIAGAALMGSLLGLPANEAMAVGAGFGWYSLSGVLLAQIYSVSTGALAFLSNVFRELIAVVLMPLLALRLAPAVALAPGGATTMDTTLPIIARCMGSEAALIAFASGATLTALVPMLVPILIRI